MEKESYISFDEKYGDKYFGQCLTCPICQEIYVHFEKPKFLKTKGEGKTWIGNGESIEIDFWCESDHYWTMRLGFHKGQTFLNLENIRLREQE